MKFRDYKPGDMGAVLMDLSPVSKREMSAMPGAVADVERMARLCGRTCEVDGRPVALFFLTVEKGTGITAFVATPAFFENFTRGVKACRRELDRAFEVSGVQRMYACTLAPPTDQTLRWFALLGFGNVKAVDGYILFERKAKQC